MQYDSKLTCKMWARWQKFNLTDDIFWQLSHMYYEPQRVYHTLYHIDDLLTKQEKWFPDVSVEVKLAIWFHDCFYLPGFDENELYSADIALHLLSDTSFKLGRLMALIMATKNHERSRITGGNALIDLDLSGLGDTPEKYDRNTENVRAEYAHYSDAEWVVGRSKFIDSFLARPKIFHTETLAHLEEPARANLARERKLYE